MIIKINRIIIPGLMFYILFSCGHYVKEKPPFVASGDFKDLPKPIDYVSDFEGILNKDEEMELTSIIKQHEKLTTDQIAVVTINSYKPYSRIDSFTTDLGNYWGVGQKDKDNGVMIVFGKTIREIRIGTGFGLEKFITDEEEQNIIDS